MFTMKKQYRHRGAQGGRVRRTLAIRARLAPAGHLAPATGRQLMRQPLQQEGGGGGGDVEGAGGVGAELVEVCPAQGDVGFLADDLGDRFRDLFLVRNQHMVKIVNWFCVQGVILKEVPCTLFRHLVWLWCRFDVQGVTPKSTPCTRAR